MSSNQRDKPYFNLYLLDKLQRKIHLSMLHMDSYEHKETAKL